MPAVLPTTGSINHPLEGHPRNRFVARCVYLDPSTTLSKHLYLNTVDQVFCGDRGGVPRGSTSCPSNRACQSMHRCPRHPGTCFAAWGLAFRVDDLGAGGWGVWFGVSALGLGFRVYGLGSRVWSLRIQSVGCRAGGSELRVSGLGLGFGIKGHGVGV